MATSRSSRPRAQSSASGRRRAGSQAAAPRSEGGKPAASKSAASKRPAGKPASKRSGKPKEQPFSVNEREQREGVRLQKYIASAGVASRRKAEELITSGQVAVNGQRVTELGTRVFPGRDRITVRGEPIRAEDKVYFVLNKPDQVVSSAAGSVDERGRPTVLSLMHGIPQRLYPVGRLDYHSRGVMILTNDGELAAALTHPRHGIVKTYHVKFQGKLSEEEEDALREGIELDDGAVTRPLTELFAFRETDANVWYQMGLTEGLNRQIRRMGDAIDHPVLKLIRVAIGDITADGLEEGEFRPLTPTEVGQMLSAVELEPGRAGEIAPASKPAAKRSTAARRPSGDEGARRRASDSERGSSSRRSSDGDRPASKRSSDGERRPASTRSSDGRPASTRSSDGERRPASKRSGDERRSSDERRPASKRSSDERRPASKRSSDAEGRSSSTRAPSKRASEGERGGKRSDDKRAPAGKRFGDKAPAGKRAAPSKAGPTSSKPRSSAGARPAAKSRRGPK